MCQVKAQDVEWDERQRNNKRKDKKIVEIFCYKKEQKTAPRLVLSQTVAVAGQHKQQQQNIDFNSIDRMVDPSNSLRRMN